MLYKLLALLCSSIVITILAGCGPTHFGSSFGPPTPTPPPGFFNVDSLVPGQHLYAPSLSADGKLLAALGSAFPEHSIPRLYVIDLENRQVLYTGEEEIWSSLAISPDGSKVAVCGSFGSGQRIYLIDWEHNDVSSLLDGCWPAWSFDGEELAFIHVVRHESERQIQIKTYSFQTHSETVIFDTPSPNGFLINHLIWAHANSQFAFVLGTGDQQPGKLDLYTIDRGSNELQKLTDGTQGVSSPKFSYDGKMILYLDSSVPVAADYYINVVDLKGNCHRLEPPVPRIYGVTLSAQGNVIALYTKYGLLVTDTEMALGEDFWTVGSLCN
jgi:Tol biopolymer transport system component